MNAEQKGRWTPPLDLSRLADHAEEAEAPRQYDVAYQNGSPAAPPLAPAGSAASVRPSGQGGPAHSRPFGLRALVVIHPAEGGRYWAEVPSLPGCVTEGDTYEELLVNLRDVIQGFLLVTPGNFRMEEPGTVAEIEL